MEVEFNHGEGKCGGGKESGKIWVEGKKIKFKGTAITPTPCYRLRLKHSFSSDGKLTLQILKRSTQEICIQCIAQISFEGSVWDVKPSEIVLKIEEKTLDRKKLGHL